MITKLMKDLDLKTQQKIVKGSVIPRPIAWLTKLNSDGSVNLAPFSFFTMLSTTLVGVSIQRVGNKQKDTTRNILRTEEAVLHIPDNSLIAAVDLSSEPLAENESEIELVGLETIASELVQVPGIKAAKIRFEVKLDHHLPLTKFDSEEIEADLILLRVVMAHLEESVIDEQKNYILPDKLNPISRLGGPDYATIKMIKDFKRKF